MTKFKPLPSQEYLQECFTYDPETGLLYWKRRPLEHFTADHVGKTWNTKHAFNLAFNTTDKDGYKTGSLNNKEFKSHRIIYKLVTGIEPEEIDHIDGDLINNRIDNLRSVSHLENMLNQSKSVNNTSGITGVYWHSKVEKWEARICKKHLGYYKSLEEASTVRKAAEVELGYHPNHGRDLQTVTL